MAKRQDKAAKAYLVRQTIMTAAEKRQGTAAKERLVRRITMIAMARKRDTVPLGCLADVIIMTKTDEKPVTAALDFLAVRIIMTVTGRNAAQVSNGNKRATVLRTALHTGAGLPLRKVIPKLNNTMMAYNNNTYEKVQSRGEKSSFL